MVPWPLSLWGYTEKGVRQPLMGAGLRGRATVTLVETRLSL